ncbi:hypothetical protein R3W88_004637 [Solanum pinnatisectum]|uniref:Uncharacterized protein n=1 Tax=Solanum pinnatisectum TaxID=50273 RepID=A0AAV9K9Z9_9SOLN|nr:hypothetical protein R3W88_004637 [Solanum pinnatisectum]
MTKSELNKLCIDENDSMINAEVRCKHGILLQMQTWRDKERVDERSRFILPKLVNRIKELEEKYERVKMQLEQLDNSNIEHLQNRYENLNINSKEKGVDVQEMGDLKEKKMKGMKMKKKDEGCRCFGKFLCCLMICCCYIC